MHLVKTVIKSFVALSIFFLTLFLAQSASAYWPQFKFSQARDGYNPFENILSASNVANLQSDWTYTTTSNIYVQTQAVVVGGVVYVPSTDQHMYALDAFTGAVKWSYFTNANIFVSATVRNGVVYFGTDDDKLYALDAQTGALKWVYTSAGTIFASATASKGSVYFISSQGIPQEANKLYALDASTGAVNWSK